MREVARAAEVSLATVSRVINGSGEVHPELVKRVSDAIDLLGYRHNATASTLRRSDRQSASIGLIIEDVSNPFFAAVHRGVEDVARVHRVLTFVGSSDEDEARERELAEAFAARGVDGLVVVPCAGDQSYLLRDQQSGIALVFVDRPPHFLRGDTVTSDNRAGARTATQQLIAAAAIQRTPTLERLGLTSSEPARQATIELLSGPTPPTALFTGQNLITIGAILALRELGRQRVIALAGFDDIVLGEIVEPGITVVAQDPYALGRHAGELLFRRLRGEASDPTTVVVPTRLIARGSGEIRPPHAQPARARSRR